MIARQLNKRVEALEGNTSAGGPLCWLRSVGETAERAIERHKEAEGCIPNSGGHVVWMVKR